MGKTAIKSKDDRTNLQITSVTGEDGGEYRLIAENTIGNEQAHFNVVVKDRPSPPRNLRVIDVNTSDVTIMWEKPDSDGGTALTEYSIEKKDAQKATFISVASTDALTHQLKVHAQFANVLSAYRNDTKRASQSKSRA